MRRIIFLIAIFLLTLSPMMGQIAPITLPADGDWPTIVGDSIMLIGPKQEALTEEQRYFNPPYLLVYPGKEHLKNDMIRATLCDCDPTKPNRRIGVFSVAPDKQVSFSQGNLQYLPAINLWKFANTQYESLGNANKYLKPTFRNWVDLFGWSANNTTAPFGVSTSTNAADYAGDFVDWGTNEICGDAPGTWRTLSADEWEYLLKKRKNASDLYGVAKVAGENGLIILPDDWKVPEGIIFKAGLHSSQVNDFSVYQSFTADEWKVMEEAGAVFLHASGYRDGATVEKCNTSGYYWSNTTSDEKSAYRLYFYSYFLAPNDVHDKYRGRSVRLVHDTVVPRTIPKRIGVFSVAADKQVSFSQGNLQYIQSTDTWQFAKEQYEYMGEKHFRNGQLADTIEYFGWSGKDSKAPWGISLFTESSDYAGEFLDWGTNTIAGSAPNTWRTLSNDEWLYICQGRKNADQLLGLGTIGTVTGLIILPDYWQLPAGLSFTPNTDNATKNQYTYNQWAELENAGAVFIATSGYFNPKLGGMRHVGGEGHIRTNALSDNGLQVYSVIKTNKIIYSYSGTQEQNLQYAFAQRLVHDTIVPKVEPEYVDLGLSVKWATFNVGATSPEDYGDYFAWGETEPKETYSWAIYKWCDGTSSNMTKYNATDGKTILEPADDAAQVHWGGNWRMPTEEEQQELIDRCSWERTNLNGVIGYKVTGPNGNSIFIPIAGAYNSFDNQLNSVGSIGWIYSSTIATEIRAYEIHIEEGGIQQKDCSRCVGLTIRPVYDDRPPKRIGVFSVGADKQVSFSQGNLQYIQSTDTWQFANNQLEYMGHKHYRNGQLADTIEYFGWSGKNSKAPWGISLSTESSDYEGEFLDWGTNTIAGDAPNTWRTLSNDEWLYICQRRKNADQLLGLGKISSIFGLIILPDDWVAPEGITFTPNDNNPNANIYSLQQWTAMEEAGAVFISPTGYFNHDIDNMRYVGTYGYARNNTLTANGLQIYTLFKPSEIQYSRSAQGNNGNLYYAFPQRLVHDTIVPQTIPEPCLVVKVNDTLSINLMCVEGGTFTMGAMEGDTQAKENEKPAHEVTLTYDYLIMQTEVTQGLWEAVMGEDIYDLISKSSSPTAQPISTRGDFPVGYVQLSQCLEFIDRLNSLTGLHFRMPTEAEWEYAARGGNQSKGYLYAGSNTLTQVAQTSLGIVAKLRPNELGIYDMSGNIAEMTLDYLPNHDIGYPSANAQVNPRQISPTGNRAIRGLRWNTTEINCRISHRNSYTTTYSGNGMGFRLVLSEEQDFRTIHFNGSYFDMSFVKGGTFKMGSDAPDAEADERPVHEVTLSDYYIGQTEVTQHLWKKVMGDENNPSAVEGNNLPVTNITWNEAQVFVQKLSELIGMRFRLPTEAEWEYAARGGQKSKGYTYAGSNDIDEVGWYNGNSSNKMHAVGQKQPNELGIYDMTGNVWEYCSDWHMPYSSQAQTNPTGAATGEKHVLRGGCYHYDSKNCTNTNRHSYYTPDNGGASTGLRIVLEE